MSLNPKDKKKLIKGLKKGRRRGKFYLSSGIKNFYISIDQVWSDPVSLSEVTEVLADFLESEEFDKIVAIDHIFPEYGSIPIASVVSFKMKKPLIIWKETGCLDYDIYGNFSPAESVVVLYDVTAKGHCLGKAVQDIRKRGGVIKKILSIVDRGEGAEQYLDKLGLKLDFLLSLNELSTNLKLKQSMERNK